MTIWWCMGTIFRRSKACCRITTASGKRRLVFAPTKYLDGIHLEENRVDFCQLPFEIYKAAKAKKP